MLSQDSDDEFDQDLCLNLRHGLKKLSVVPLAMFQSGSRVLKRCSESFLIYIYGIQCDFMQKSN